MVEGELDAKIVTKRRSKATTESRKRKLEKAATGNGCPKEDSEITVPVKEEQDQEDQRRPCPSDATDHLNPLEEYWIDEGDGVCYKHDIKIEKEEDVSPEGDSSPKRRRF